MKKLFKFLALPLTSIILLLSSTLVSAVTNTGTDNAVLLNQAQVEYDKYKQLTCSPINSQELFEWKFNFQNKLKFLKATIPFKNFLEFFMHFLECKNGKSLPNSTYVDAIISIEWPTKDMKSGEITVQLINSVETSDLKIKI